MVRWYGLMYVIGFGVGWWLGRRRASQRGLELEGDRRRRRDLLRRARRHRRRPARLGAVLRLRRIHARPGDAVSHLGRRHVVSRRPARRAGIALQFLPAAASATSPTSSISSRRCRASGLFAGRVGNFINGELWGKPTDVPWGFTVDPAVLHPAQAAEAHRLCERFARRSLRAARSRFAALRRPARRPGAVRDPVGVHREAAAAACAVRAVSAFLRACSVSPWNSCACRTRIAATCCSTG